MQQTKMPPILSKCKKDCEKVKKFFWKGKRVSEKVYLNKKKQQDVCNLQSATHYMKSSSAASARGPRCEQWT